MRRRIHLELKERNLQEQAVMRSQIARAQYNNIEEALAKSIAQRIKAGKQNEARVDEALEYLKEAGEIYNYFPAWERGELDLRRIDRIIIPESPKISKIWMIPLQVKSSLTGLEKHTANSAVPCIVVQQHIPLRILAKQILIVLGLSTEFLKGVVQTKESGFKGYFAKKIREALDPERVREEILVNEIIRKLQLEH